MYNPSHWVPLHFDRKESFMNKVLLHVSDGLRRAVDPASVYYLEAVRGDTVLRRRGARTLKDIRQLGEVMRVWKSHGFVRVHRNHAVNSDHVLEIRLRPGSQYWEVKLAPPVNRVLPVSRNYLKDLWAAFGQPK
jgi:DNA-binding LytR/AlgR family response regulator